MIYVIAPQREWFHVACRLLRLRSANAVYVSHHRKLFGLGPGEQLVVYGHDRNGLVNEALGRGFHVAYLSESSTWPST